MQSGEGNTQILDEVLDTYEDGNNGVWVKDGVRVEQGTDGAVLVDLSDGLDQNEQDELKLSEETTFDHNMEQNWVEDGGHGDVRPDVDHVLEIDEQESAYASVARYADAHGISFDQALRIYRESTSFSRQNLREQGAERLATRSTWVSEYNTWKAAHTDGTFTDWVKEKFGITAADDAVLHNLQVYLASHADATPEQLVDFLLLNGFAARLPADIQTEAAEGDNPGLGLDQPITGRTPPEGYTVAVLEPFYKNAPAAETEGTVTRQAEASPPPAAETPTPPSTEASTDEAFYYIEFAAGTMANADQLLTGENPNLTRALELYREAQSQIENLLSDPEAAELYARISGKIEDLEGQIAGSQTVAASAPPPPTEAPSGSDTTAEIPADTLPETAAAAPPPPASPTPPIADETPARADAPTEQITIDAGELFRQGEEAFRRGEYQQAIDLYQTAFDNLPGGRPLMEMARCQIALGRAEEARATLARLRSEYPNFVAFPAYDEYVSGLEASLSPPSVIQTAPQESRLDEPPPTAPPPPPSTPAVTARSIVAEADRLRDAGIDAGDQRGGNFAAIEYLRGQLAELPSDFSGLADVQGRLFNWLREEASNLVREEKLDEAAALYREAVQLDLVDANRRSAVEQYIIAPLLSQIQAQGTTPPAPPDTPPLAVDITHEVATLRDNPPPAPATPVVSPEPEIVPGPAMGPAIVAEASPPPPPAPTGPEVDPDYTRVGRLLTGEELMSESLAPFSAIRTNLWSVDGLPEGMYDRLFGSIERASAIMRATERVLDNPNDDSPRGRIESGFREAISAERTNLGRAILDTPDDYSDDQAVLARLANLYAAYDVYKRADGSSVPPEDAQLIALYEGLGEDIPDFLHARLAELREEQARVAAAESTPRAGAAGTPPPLLEPYRPQGVYADVSQRANRDLQELLQRERYQQIRIGVRQKYDSGSGEVTCEVTSITIYNDRGRSRTIELNSEGGREIRRVVEGYRYSRQARPGGPDRVDTGTISVQPPISIH